MNTPTLGAMICLCCLAVESGSDLLKATQSGLLKATQTGSVDVTAPAAFGPTLSGAGGNENQTFIGSPGANASEPLMEISVGFAIPRA